MNDYNATSPAAAASVVVRRARPNELPRLSIWPREVAELRRSEASLFKPDVVTAISPICPSGSATYVATNGRFDDSGVLGAEVSAPFLIFRRREM